MNPLRIVRSEAAREAVAPGSLVCAAYSLRTIFEKQNTNEWVEPGCEEAWSTAAIWEHMTGAYETIVLDDDREVWVLIDAAAPELVRPPPGFHGLVPVGIGVGLSIRLIARHLARKREI